MVKTTLQKSLSQNVFKKFTDKFGTKSEHDFLDMLYSRYTVEDEAYGDDMYYFGVMKYFEEKVIPHKIAVYEAGLQMVKYNANLYTKNMFKSDTFRQTFLNNLWEHDMSKFSANEAFGYALYDFKNPSPDSKAGFEKAWHNHKMNNPHHPEYWLNPNRSGILEPLPMPDIYILEMIADWMGASTTYGSTLEEWMPKNLPKFKFANIERVAELIRLSTSIQIQVDAESLFVKS